MTGFWDHAHNDYLEFAAETGIIGAWLLGVALLLTLAMALNTLYRRRRALNRGIAFGITMAITALLIHSIVDFNLQIPANAATFMLILGLGWVVRYLPSATTARTHRKRQPPSRLVKSVTLSLMVGLIYLVYVAGSWGLANFFAWYVHAVIVNWEKEGFVAKQWPVTLHTSALALGAALFN